MIYASRHVDRLGIVEAAQARAAAAVAGLVARGMAPERAVAKTTGQWGGARPPAPVPVKTLVEALPVAHSAIRTVYAMPVPIPDYFGPAPVAHVLAWRQYCRLWRRKPARAKA